MIFHFMKHVQVLSGNENNANIFFFYYFYDSKAFYSFEIMLIYG